MDCWRCLQANIRGGGEYGPKWHQAALQENRNKAYEDFIAVGEDLVKRGVCTTKTLGCQGGSNGGLLVGNMLVRSLSPDYLSMPAGLQTTALSLFAVLAVLCARV